VASALIDSGFRVRGQYARKPGPDPRIEWHQANFLEKPDFDRLADGCDGIIHLAAELARAETMQRVNVEATEQLINAAVRAGTRYFGHASSMVVYGSPDRKDIDERSPIINPFFPLQRQYYAPPTTLEYARTKAMSEIVVRQAEARLNIGIFRITKSAGFERLLESLHWGLARRMMWLYARTHCIFDEDCVHAIVHLARRGLVQTRSTADIYNIGDATCGTYLSLLKRAEARLGSNRVGIHYHVPVLLEAARAALKYRTLAFRYPTGMISISNQKLLGTGFRMPVGYDRAIDLALHDYTARLAR
jgi:nucleoside-diphosphate-sugar epimerase